ncbi:hypothetical protein MDAP_000547 [Mitosporidium daphniae]|uniref:Putative programmed cell death protein n=1 Tax=Mitosporidium daphniae TaxID=1485682 RepID=A0A098VQH4_9MICR|nr:putative programmed cell death protein [Mitosporidium daphniae]KGG51225.1 putative programmed cell death protein [Mitosporidium daphniae]|eukprot:XP_013237652.1 putative programmed cell death protein [Mitosporidium daphniae]
MDFPRGGKPILPHHERKRLFMQASKNVQSNKKKAVTAKPARAAFPKKFKKIRRSANHLYKDAQFEDGLDKLEVTMQGPLPFIHPLSHGRLTPEMHLLGIVKRRISSTSIIISLPNNLQGRCTDANLVPGSLAQVKVVEDSNASGKKARIIHLEVVKGSTKPAEGTSVMSTVTSVEEQRGFLISINEEADKVGFLPNPCPDLLDLRPGMPLLVTISSFKGRIPRLSLPGEIHCTRNDLSFEEITPGTVFSGSTLLKYIPGRGALLSLGETTFRATADCMHINTEEKKEGARLGPCIVLWTESTERSVGVSFLPHLLTMSERLGSFAKLSTTGSLPSQMELSVCSLIPGFGSLLASSMMPFAAQRFFSSEIQSKVGDIATAVPVDWNAIDNTVTVTMANSTPIDITTITRDTVALGMVVWGTVTRVDNSMMVVEIGEGFHGVCPRFHWFEKNDHRSNKSAPLGVGDRRKFRVLAFSSSGSSQPLLTRKPALLRIAPNIPIVSDRLGLVAAGTLTVGYALVVKERFVIFGFYGDARGILATTSIPNVKVQAGDVHELRIIGFDERRALYKVVPAALQETVSQRKFPKHNQMVDASLERIFNADGAMTAFFALPHVYGPLKATAKLHELHSSDFLGRILSENSSPQLGASAGIDVSNSCAAIETLTTYGVGDTFGLRVSSCTSNEVVLEAPMPVTGPREVLVKILTPSNSVMVCSVIVESTLAMEAPPGILALEGPRIPLKLWHLDPSPCKDEAEAAAAERKFGPMAKDPNDPITALSLTASFRRALMLANVYDIDEKGVDNGSVNKSEIPAKHENGDTVATKKQGAATKAEPTQKHTFSLRIPIPVLASRFTGSLWEAAIATRKMLRQERISPPSSKILANRMVVGVVSGIHPTMGLFMAFDETSSGLVLPRNATPLYSQTWWQQVPPVGAIVQAWIVPGCESLIKLSLSLKGPIRKGHLSRPLAHEEAALETPVLAEEDRTHRSRGASILASIQEQAQIPSATDSSSIYMDEETDSDSDSDSETEAEVEVGLNPDLQAHPKTAKGKMTLDPLSVDFIERALADPARVPSTHEDHERAVLADPASSLNWIAYMAFESDAGSMERARAVAERALAAIPYRAEGEKLNIWIAWLRLEWAFSESKIDTVKDNFDEVLAEGLARASSSKHLLLAAWQLVTDTIKNNGIQRPRALRLISHLENLMLAKPILRASGKIWLALLSLEYLGMRSSSSSSSSSSLMGRAKSSLAPPAFIKLQTRLSLQAYCEGDFSMGRSMIESIIGQHPKRFDLWMLYLQAERKGLRGISHDGSATKKVSKLGAPQPSVEYLRKLYERVAVLPFSSKRMKSLFKTFLDFEKSFGSQAHIERVRQLAVSYVERQ